MINADHSQRHDMLHRSCMHVEHLLYAYITFNGSR